MAMTGDMSVVSREYERSIINAWKNFVAGDIVRMVRTEPEHWYNCARGRSWECEWFGSVVVAFTCCHHVHSVIVVTFVFRLGLRVSG